MEFEALCPTRNSFRKTFFYNLFATKMEERRQLSLIEIRDIYPPPAPESIIKKIVSPYEIAYRKLVVSCDEMLDKVIRYWRLEIADYLCKGARVGVVLWDVTEEQNPKHYQIFVQMVADDANDDHFVLSCMELFRDRKLKLHDDICLCWDSERGCFRVKAQVLRDPNIGNDIEPSPSLVC
ncbi:hypothetical protein ACS0TY_023622 [Phlomoides rotata]